MTFNRNSIYTIILPVLVLLATPAPANEPAVSWRDPVRIASGDAHVGPWRMNESAFHYVDDPTVAMNNRGTIGVAWADQSRQDIVFQRRGANDQLDEPANVSRSPDIFSWLPKMVITDDDPAHVYILWQEIVFSGGSHGGEAFFARSTDGGHTFDDPINLSNSEAGDGKGRLTRIHWHNGSLDLVRGPAGNLYAAWTEYEGRLWISRSSNHGESFTAPVPVAGDNQVPARGPSLAVGGDGTVYIAWTVGEDPSADIRFAMSKDRGESFSEPRRLHAGDGHADAPKLAVDGSERIHLVYGESPVGAGMPHHYRIRYARSDDNGTTFSQAKVISDAASQQTRGAGFPALDLDGDGNPYVIWELIPANLKGRSRGLGMTYSNDGGSTFTTPSVIPGSIDPELGTNGSRQGLLMKKLAVNETGAIAVVNSTFRENEASHIWLIRGHKDKQQSR